MTLAAQCYYETLLTMYDPGKESLAGAFAHRCLSIDLELSMQG
jgi:hypothetical protein